MWNVPCSNVIPRRFAVTLLIVKEYVSVKSLEKFSFISASQKQGFVYTNIPCSERFNNPLVSWSGTSGN